MTHDIIRGHFVRGINLKLKPQNRSALLALAECPPTDGGVIRPQVKTIKLTQNKVALVDDSDFTWLNQFKWCAVVKRRRSHSYWYASRRSKINGKHTNIFMHSFILGVPPRSQVDHKNHNGLDNQRQNLRSCSTAQNQRNKRKFRGRSRYKGVWLHVDKRTKSSFSRWRAQIVVNGKTIRLGCFKNELDAAKVYDRAAIKYFKEFACTNKMLGLL